MPVKLQSMKTRSCQTVTLFYSKSYQYIYNSRIYINSSVQNSNPNNYLAKWKSVHPDYFSANIYILILNNCIESFNKFLFISPKINQLIDKISTWLTQVGNVNFLLKFQLLHKGKYVKN